MNEAIMVADQIGNLMQVGSSIVSSLDSLVQVAERQEDAITCEVSRCDWL